MAIYRDFNRFSLDPRNEREVLDLAIQRAYQTSGGQLNSFNAGSPLMVLLEALTFAHMEFLHWENQLPEVMILTFIAEVLGAKRSLGSYCKTTIRVNLTADLKTDFILNAGTIIYSNKNSNKYYSLETDLVIPAGQTIGFVDVTAYTTGEQLAVEANELTILQENFSYVESVTNLTASTIGSDFEDLDTVRQRVLTLMSQRTPVSEADWGNLIELTYPGKKYKVLTEDSVLYLYIQDWTSDPVFEAYVASVRGVLQKILIAPYKKAELEIEIKSSIDFTQQAALDIAIDIVAFLYRETDKLIQPIDIYQNLANNYLNNSDIDEFDVYYYRNSINPEILNLRQFGNFDYPAGTLTKDLSGTYYECKTNFNIVNGPNDEAAIGLLTFHPVYSGPGEYTNGDIVQFGAQYYLVDATGPVLDNMASNITLLGTPDIWVSGRNNIVGDLFIENTDYTGLRFGYTVDFNYTSEASITSNFIQVFPVSLSIGQSVNANEYFYIQAIPEIIYRNGAAALTLSPTNYNTLQVQVGLYPVLQHLTRTSRYRIGQLTEDQNYIYINSSGDTTPIPSGLVITEPVEAQSDYGYIFEDNGIVYEVKESFVPTNTDTITSLLAGGFISRAYRLYGDFEVLTYTGFRPTYFDISSIKFIQPNTIAVKKVSGTYTIV